MLKGLCEPRRLGPADDLSGFSCGAEKIDNWIAKHASKATKRRTAVVYATFDADKKCAGLYALSAHSMDRGALSGWLARNAPDQVPVILLGMLAVDKRYAGKGLGAQLLLDAYHRAQGAAETIGVKALVVDPLDDPVVSFYTHHGFEQVPGSDRLFARFA